MSSRNRAIAAVVCAILLVIPVSATYAGDKPLVTAFSGEINGDYRFTTGNSSYSGTLHSGDRYPVEFSVDLPQDAILRYQRYYLYWAWSRKDQQAIYPSIAASTSLIPGESVLPMARYIDNKGFTSSSDFYSGMDTFSGGNLSPGKNQVFFVATNTGEGNSTFVIQGAGLLVIYESPESPEGVIVVKEGCDMLYNSFGITPEMATSTTSFDTPIDVGRVRSATLELIAPSAGYSRSDIVMKNAVCFNSADQENVPGFFSVVLDLIFPQMRGKEWDDAFYSDQQMQIGEENLLVTPYLVPKNNYVSVQDRGDYLLFTNAIFRVNYQ